MGGEDATEAGREAGPDDDGEPADGRLGVEIEEGADLVLVVGARDHVAALLEQPLGRLTMTARGEGEDSHVGALGPARRGRHADPAG